MKKFKGMILFIAAIVLAGCVTTEKESKNLVISGAASFNQAVSLP